MNNELNITQDDYIAGRLDREKTDKVSAMEENGTVFEVVLKPLDDGRWHAWCPVLKGCHTWGHTQAEAMFYIQDAVNLYIEDLIACGESIPGVGKVTELKPIIRLQDHVQEKVA
jgi:predicted RNase H-like HicB family nuclease